MKAPAFILRHRSLDRATEYPAYAACLMAALFGSTGVAAVFDLPMTFNMAYLLIQVSFTSILAMVALFAVTHAIVWFIR